MLRANGRRDVFVGAAMVGGFDAGDFAMRNVLLVTVADDETVVLVDLARAHGREYRGGGDFRVRCGRPEDARD